MVKIGGKPKNTNYAKEHKFFGNRKEMYKFYGNRGRKIFKFCGNRGNMHQWLRLDGCPWRSRYQQGQIETENHSTHIALIYY